MKQIDPATGDVIKTWTARNHIVIDQRVSATRLRKAIAAGTEINGFLWKEA